MTLPVSTEPLPTSYAFGKVVGRVVHLIADTAEDTDDKPQARAAAGKVYFTPKEVLRKTSDADYPAIVLHAKESASLSGSGRILDAEGRQGIWLAAGIYRVEFDITGARSAIPPFDVEVTTAHTDAAPLDLATVVPYVPPSGTVVQTVVVPSGGTEGQVLVRTADGGLAWADQSGGTGGGAVDSVNGQTGIVALDAADVGAQPAGDYATTSDVTAASTADRNRTNHTGTQDASTITGLASVATSGSYNDLSDKPADSGGGVGAGVDADDVGFDVILLVGRSNMVGSGTDTVPARRAPVDPRIYTWDADGAYARKLSQAPTAGLHFPVGASLAISPGHVAALDHVRTLPSNRRILLVPAAVSGSTFSTGPTADAGPGTWDAGSTGGNLYDQSVRLAREALASHPNNRMAAVLWHEAESNRPKEQYAGKLDELITAFRTDLGVPDLPFVCAGAVPEWNSADPNKATNQEALREVTDRLARTAFVEPPLNSYNTGGGGEEIHFSNVGSIHLGHGYAQGIAYAQDHTTPGVSPTIPAPAAVTALAPVVDGTTVDLAWLPSPTAYNYRVRYRPTSSGTWLGEVVASDVRYTLAGLNGQTDYTFEVTPYGAGGIGTVATTTATTAGEGGSVGVAYSDSFDGTTNASISTGGWTVPTAPTADIVYETARATPSTGAVSNFDRLAVRDVGSPDGTVTVTLGTENAVTVAWTAGAVVRYVDTNNYIEIRDSKVRVKSGGTWTDLVTGITAMMSVGTLSVALSGPSIVVTHNGVEVASTSTTTHQQATMHGFAMPFERATADNFSYTPAA